MEEEKAEEDTKLDDALASWKSFYKTFPVFRKTYPRYVDAPGWPEEKDFSRLIVMPPGLTYRIVLEECRRHFIVDCPYENLDQELWRREDRHPNRGAYGIFVRDRIQADSENHKRSKDEFLREGAIGLTLMECLMLHLKHFNETGKYLDSSRTATLCWMSFFKNGKVPYVYVAGNPARQVLFIRECAADFFGRCPEGRDVRSRTAIIRE